VETIKLDIIPQGVNPKFYVSQGDDLRALGVYLTENNEPYNLTGSEAVYIEALTVNNTYFRAQLENTGGDFLSFEILTNLTSKAGLNYCKIIIETDEQKIGTSAFFVIVEKKP